MNLLFRLLLVLWHGRGQCLDDVLSPSLLRLRVLPNDLDLNFHLNNGRYLSLMDLGRVDLLLRLGLLGKVLRQRWMPILASARIEFRRPLAPFEAYHLHSQIIGWDEKWFYIEQRFIKLNGDLAARAFVRGCLRRRDGTVPTAEIMNLLGHMGDSPALPADVML